MLAAPRPGVRSWSLGLQTVSKESPQPLTCPRAELARSQPSSSRRQAGTRVRDVPEEGIEPTRTFGPRDFETIATPRIPSKSDVSARPHWSDLGWRWMALDGPRSECGYTNGDTRHRRAFRPCNLGERPTWCYNLPGSSCPSRPAPASARTRSSPPSGPVTGARCTAPVTRRSSATWR